MPILQAAPTPIRRIALVLVLLALVVAPQNGRGRAEAAGELHVSWMQVTVMPEYDQPQVVVIAQAKLVDPVLPTDLRLVLPANVKVTHACYLKQPGNEHVCQTFKTATEDAGTVLTYQVPAVDFLVEYRYASVSSPGQHSFDYSFLAPYSTDKLEILFQEPSRSRDFAVSPAAASQSNDEQGFRYHDYGYTNVSPGQPFAFQFKYVKDDILPSVSPTAAADPARTSKYLIYGIVIVGGPLAALALLASRRGGGRVLRWSTAGASANSASASAGNVPGPRSSGRAAARRASDHNSVASGPTPTSNGSGSPSREPVANAGTTRFCTNCGMSLTRPGPFCPSCGSAVRQETASSP